MRLLLLFLALTLTSCSSKYVFEGSEENVKKNELQLWQVLNYREPYSNSIHHEDDRYIYDVQIEKFVKDKFTNTNVYASSTCPVGAAEYTVTDKETKKIIRHETHTQSNCASCHKR